MLFVVDARVGITPGDEELAQILRESKKNVLVLANKIDDPSQEMLALEFHRLGFGEPFPICGLHGSNTGDLLDEILDLLPGESTRDDARRRDPGRDPRPAERRQVVALQQARRRGAHDRLRGSGHDARHDRHDHRARGADVPARRHRRAAPQAQAAAGHRVLLGAARARGRRARRRRARPDRRGRGNRRRRHHRRRGRAQVALRDADRALEVGHLRDHDRGGSSRAAASAAPAPGLHHHLVAHGPRRLAPARQGRRSCTTATSSRVPTAELNKFIAELKEMRQAPSKGVRRLNLLYGAQVTTRPPRFRFTVNDPGLVTRDYALLGGEPAARAVPARGRAGGGRLPRSAREIRRRRRRGVGERVCATAPRRARTTCSSRGATRSTTRRTRRPTSSSSPCRAARSARCSGTFAATRRCSASSRASTRRPAIGSRRSSRAVPSRCSRGRTWRRRSPTGLPGAAVIASRGRGARARVCRRRSTRARFAST